MPIGLRKRDYKALAKQCGVSVQTFSSWVNNKTQPDLLQAYQLSKLLGVSMEDLVEGEND
ncbi:helix-turn-helix transcriptional regulator [Parageobacillus thermoglucosidasius]|uniref:helix-turn-helix transcriptional regulator n=1 Tax=Parageobacillus thermoglucosidasius TaxID=1426 RepID=UPI0021AB424C|nr:helix-turn-helix transcriptional regulator [Parageobacillus thermoglucosidasius]